MRTAEDDYGRRMSSASREYDVIVVGGGHNGLTAATYAARAGRSVLVLERLDRLGGAATYSPVAALPQQLVADLDLDLRLEPAPAAADELTRAVLPTLLGPLPLERDVRDRVDPDRWTDLATTPLDVHHRLRAATPAVAGGGATVAAALEAAARAADVEVLTSAGVSAIRPDGPGADVTWHDGMTFHTASARVVLANVAPWVLSILLGGPEDPDTKPQGSDVLVQVRPGQRPHDLLAADSGSLHWDEGSGLLTYTGPAGPEAVLADLGELVVVTPEEVERDLAMPGGHWFHGDVEWPWAPHRARLDTPAQQWGVQTDVDAVLLCGAGSRRGGGVTGLGGHHAAHAVLAML